MKKVRVGFVGAGGIAVNHLKNIQKNEQAEIVAICDTNEEAARQKAGVYGGSVYTSFDEMIEQEQLDALFISVPPFAHGEMEEKAARKGIHLMVEKPLGLDLETVLRKAEVIKQSGIICASGYCLRYLDTIQKAKDYLQDKKVAMLNGHYLTMFVPTPWYREMEKSGGQLVEQSTHIVDLARYLGGEMAQVHANMSLQVHGAIENITIPDVTSVNIVFDTGAVGNIASSFAQFDHRMGLEIMGEDFRVILDGVNVSIIEKDQTITYKSRVDVYKVQDDAFIEAILTGNQELILSTYEDGLKTLAVTLAANQSNETGVPVKLPLGGESK